MNRFFALFLFAASLMTSCGINEGIPFCVQEIIDGERFPMGHSPQYILQYRYKGGTVYYLNNGCCDQYNYLIDSRCNVICSPDGGEFGDGDGECRDFHEVATFKEIVWCKEQETCDSLEESRPWEKFGGDN